MSGKTNYLCHPRRWLAGIYPKKDQMDARLTMSGMTEADRLPIATGGNDKNKKQRSPFLWNPGAADGVGICAEPDGSGRMVVEHMADGSAAAWDIGETDDLSCSCIETDKTI